MNRNRYRSMTGMHFTVGPDLDGCQLLTIGCIIGELLLVGSNFQAKRESGQVCRPAQVIAKPILDGFHHEYRWENGAGAS